MTELHTHMPTEVALPSIAQATATLKKMVEAAAIQITSEPAGDTPQLRRFSVDIDLPDALDWLSRQRLFPKVYWMNREKSEWIAGIGEADRIEVLDAGSNERSFLLVEQAIRQKHPSARYLGGFCFNNRQARNRIWSAFSPALFILPLISIERSGTGAAISCSLWTTQDGNPVAACTRLIEALEAVDTEPARSTAALPEVTGMTYMPERKEWIENCRDVFRSFDAGEMEKVILARQTTLAFSGQVQAIRFLINYPYPESSTYRFYFEPREGDAFFSFTPERLYRRDGLRLLTEALAGTVTKEALNADDDTASALLLNSEKDVREHRFVKDTIFSELQPVCSEIDMEETVQVLQLSSLAHLYTRCRATLRPECGNDSTVLRQLHPTPAVGGVPREASMQRILSIEPFCRGWYAGPVGWLSQDAAEFAVGIRSALVSDGHAYVYSGAGLVQGSDPGSEWEEVDQKIGEILAITRQAL